MLKKKRMKQMGNNGDFLNPKRRFKSINEAGNYFKSEMTDDKVIEYLKKAEMPINFVDFRENHNNLIKMLSKLPQKTVEEKLFKYYMLEKTARRSLEILNGLNYNWKRLCAYLSDFFGLDDEQIIDLDKRSLEHAKNYFSKRDGGMIIF